MSQSSIVRVYAQGEIRAEIVPELFLLSRDGLFTEGADVQQVPEAGITYAVLTLVGESASGRERA